MKNDNFLCNDIEKETSSVLINCFWSYAHDDEEHDGRILTLINDVTNEFSAIVGEPVGKYFVDRENLKWGDLWKEKIDQSIAALPIFIPIITPTYFNRPYCTYELKTFLSRLDDEFGSTHCALLPILYIDIPEFSSDDTEDELINRIKKTQWFDWRKLRFAERHSSEYRIGLNEIAVKLKQKNTELEKYLLSKGAKAAEETEVLVTNKDSDKEGFFEIAISMQDTIVDVQSSLERATDAAETISTIIDEDFTNKLETQNKPHSAILYLLNSLAIKLDNPVETLYQEATIFSTKMGELNFSLPIFIDGLQTIDTPEAPQKETICSLWNSMLSLRDIFSNLKFSIDSAIQGSEGIAKLSSTIRQPLRKQNKALNLMIEAFINYEQMIDSLEFLNAQCK